MITQEEFENLKCGDKVLLSNDLDDDFFISLGLDKCSNEIVTIEHIFPSGRFGVEEKRTYHFSRKSIEKIIGKAENMQRMSKNEYYLNIAKAVSERSTCLRRNYGAIIVKNDQIISTGYNGSARGEPNCCDVGTCYREAHNIPHGEQYEKCVAVHAEQNAISSGNGQDIIGSTLYLYGKDKNGQEIEAEPCLMCRRAIINAKINNVISSDGKGNYRDRTFYKKCFEF